VTTSKSHRVQQVVDAFVRFEEDWQMWDRSLFHRRFWHQIRYDLYSMLVIKLGLLGPRQGWGGASSFWELFRPRSLHARHVVERNSWADLSPADLLVFNHYRHVWDGRQWVCPYSHPLLENLSRSNWTIEIAKKGRHHHPMFNDRLKYIDANMVFALAKAAFRLGARKLLLRAADRLEINDWISGLEQEFGCVLDRSQVYNLVRERMVHIVGFKDLYRLLLDRVKPKAILQVVHYSDRSLNLTPIAKERGIPVVELQHGTIGPAHLAYHFAPTRKPLAFPDYLLTFGSFWSERATSLPIERDRLVDVGFAWLNRFRPRSISENRKNKVLLFLSQSSIGAAFSRLAADAARLIRDEDVRVLYRLHPAEISGWKERYPWLADSDCLVQDQPSSVYDDFSRASAQVGVYSTALFEGLAFHLPTFVARLPGHEAALPLVDCGAAVSFDDAEQLVAAFRDASRPPPDLSDTIWRPDACKRFYSFVEDLIGQSQ
jgi:hypothetical protein